MSSAILVHWQWRLPDGTLIEDSRPRNRPVLLRLDDDSISTALKNQLADITPGEQRVFSLPGTDIFGQYEPNRVQFLERQRFPEPASLKEGLIIEFAMPDGQTVPGVIKQIVGDSVTIDFNPPWLETQLTIEVECLGPAPVRDDGTQTIPIRLED